MNWSDFYLKEALGTILLLLGIAFLTLCYCGASVVIDIIREYFNEKNKK